LVHLLDVFACVQPDIQGLTEVLEFIVPEGVGPRLVEEFWQVGHEKVVVPVLHGVKLVGMHSYNLF